MEINAKKRLEASELEIGEEIFAEINLNEAIHGDLSELIKEHLLPGITAAKEKYERAVNDTERKLKAWALLSSTFYRVAMRHEVRSDADATANENVVGSLQSVTQDVKALAELANQLQSSLSKFRL